MSRGAHETGVTAESAAGRGPMPRGAKLALQAIAFLVSAGLFIWALSIVLSPENRAQLEHLRNASVVDVALLALLCGATVALNGEAFRLQLAPVRKLGFVHVQAVNAFAAILSYLPFKVSVLFRVAVHRTRDRLPVLTIGAWMTAVGVVMLVTYGPLLGAGFIRGGGKVDAMWGGLALGGAALCAGAMVGVARFFRNEPRWEAFSGWMVRRATPGFARPVVEGPDGLMARAHEGVRMLSSWRAVGACVALRLLDVAVHSARIYLAARILHIDVAVEHAILAGSAYFLIGAVNPGGQVGAREASTAAILAALIPGLDYKQFMVAPVLVTAVEVAVWAALGGAGLLHLFLRGKRPGTLDLSTG